MSEKFRYRVTHPDYGAVEITAVDRLRAVSGAGVIWEVPWTSIARQCGCERLGPAAEEAPAKETPAKKTVKKTAAKGKAKGAV